MKKTNVMIEVSDDVYDDIVLPFKKRKAFGKLVVQLLEAYRDNDAINGYINGITDNIENEATEELLKDLNSMAESLSMFGALHSEAEAVLDNGKEDVREFSQRAQESTIGDTDKSDRGSESGTNLSRDDVVEIVNDSVADIKDMLQKLLSQGVVTSSVAEDVGNAVHEHVTNSVNNSIKNEPAPVEEVKDDGFIETAYDKYDRVAKESEPSEEESQLATDALSSLMGSLGLDLGIE